MAKREDTQKVIDTAIRAAIAQVVRPGEPIRVDCELPGHKGEWVDYIPHGWRYKHLREYEEALSAAEIARLIVSRVHAWQLTTDGAEIPFEPIIELRAALAAEDNAAKKDLLRMRLDEAGGKALDELDPVMSAFVWASFRTAYSLAGALLPNESSPSPTSDSTDSNTRP